MRPLPAGSFLALSTLTADTLPGGVAAGSVAYQQAGIPVKRRTREEVADLFRGLELLDPGVVLVHRWRPDDQTPTAPDDQVHMYCGVAVKR
jgi:S-adenosyl methyltransferase